MPSQLFDIFKLNLKNVVKYILIWSLLCLSFKYILVSKLTFLPLTSVYNIHSKVIILRTNGVSLGVVWSIKSVVCRLVVYS